MRPLLLSILLLLSLISCTQTPAILPKDPTQIQLIKDTIEESPSNLDTVTVLPSNNLIVQP
ncbi:hypothetical protein EI427_24220 [Flammeovirga pectinis]|uniref:Uncharacterized protein n=1 Tax=Flammeovirga pectinis TaxID=2494373 RepID=A0A3Q9FQ28_9BACT|nr:hypothetical protein [Flammeovirga pectinis]AZQ65323.1 hypothetical protein EI427_24220 [Flammeovirga pectinis]